MFVFHCYFIEATGHTPGAAFHLPPSPEGGLVLRGTSGVPVLPGKELRASLETVSMCECCSVLATMPCFL